MKSKAFLLTLPIMLLAAGLSSCNPESSVSVSDSSVSETSVSVPVLDKEPDYDSADTAVIFAVSTVNNTVTFYNYGLCRSYTLSFDGTTSFSDKYGTALTASQLKPGTIVDLTFLRKKKKLVSCRDNADAFRVSELSDFSFDIYSKVFSYKGDSYKITEGTVLLSGNRQLSLQELSPLDTVTISGRDTEIYSITLDRGHGYLKLKGSENFIDGYLDTGAGDIELITENMLLMFPEGDYSMTITKNGGSAVRRVSVEAGKEAVLDLSDITMEEAKLGKVLFDVKPSSAKVYVDGELKDVSKLLTFPQGLHLLFATADGYQSITKYFNLGKDTVSIEVDLEENEETTTAAEEDKTLGYYVFVSNPSDVEVYLDGNYIGMSPLSFAKKSGSHTITLRKAGYETRTYTVLIENAKDDVYYSFDNLALAGTVTGTTGGTTEKPEEIGDAGEAGSKDPVSASDNNSP